jgi:RNA polymerase sigma factor (sigma-70 family)
MAGRTQERRRGVWRMSGPTHSALLLEMVNGKTDHSERQAKASAKIRHLLSRLDERSRAVIKMRWGMDGEPPKTQAKVAQSLGINQATVSRLEQKAMAKLRAAA